MPELPEVENLSQGLAAQVLGLTIEDVRCHFPAVVDPDPDRFAEAVRGRSFENLRRHGKYLFFRLSGDVTLALHLRMTGQLLLIPKVQSVDKHTHLEVFLESQEMKIVFRDVRKFGRLKLLEGGVEEFVREKKLGPDALGISAVQLYSSLRKTGRCIKAALLDQTVVAGLGNIYTDEILFREQISPLSPACALDSERTASLLRSVHRILRTAIRSKGTTISDYVDSRGEKGSFQNALMVYGREGQPCSRCGTSIVKTRVAGRGTYFCPACQC
jgi:formamidopyrimidine-DNA glycosylase